MQETHKAVVVAPFEKNIGDWIAHRSFPKIYLLHLPQSFAHVHGGGTPITLVNAREKSFESVSSKTLRTMMPMSNKSTLKFQSNNIFLVTYDNKHGQSYCIWSIFSPNFNITNNKSAHKIAPWPLAKWESALVHVGQLRTCFKRAQCIVEYVSIAPTRREICACLIWAPNFSFDVNCRQGIWELNGECSPFRRHFLAGGNEQNPLDEPVDFSTKFCKDCLKQMGNFVKLYEDWKLYTWWWRYFYETKRPAV